MTGIDKCRGKGTKRMCEQRHCLHKMCVRGNIREEKREEETAGLRVVELWPESSL